MFATIAAMARKSSTKKSTQLKQAPEPQFDVANAVDDLRQLIAKADALAHATEDLFDGVFKPDDDEDLCRLERVAHLLGATTEAVHAAVEASSQLAADLIMHRAARD